MGYWESFGISKDTLEKYFVYNTKSVFVDNKLHMRGTDTNPIFTYLYPPSTNVKVYRPLSTDRSKKWKSSTTKNDIDGIHQLPKKGKLLIVTSSRKEVMLLRELGFSAISCTSETTMVPSKIFEKLNRRFKHVVTMMDSDDAGYLMSSKYADKYNTRSIFVPKKYNHKDLSDFRKKFKKKKTYKMLKKIIKDLFNKRNLPY